MRHALPVEAAMVVGVYAAYEASRGVVAGSPALAERHAGEVVSIERSLHVFVEGDVQRAVDYVGGLAFTLGVAYLTLHLALTGLVLIWLHRQRPAVIPSCERRYCWQAASPWSAASPSPRRRRASAGSAWSTRSPATCR